MFGNEEAVLPGNILTILRDLGVGLNNHSNWVKRFHRAMICNEELPRDDMREDAHHRCEFGKWYHGDIDARLKGLPMFDEVGELHERVHEQARRLLRIHEVGAEVRTVDYDCFMDAAQTFRVAVQNLQFHMFSQVCAVDHLTGVWNRYALAHKLAQERERVRRSGTPCAIAIVDFDFFKAINDNHGHVAGDHVLKVAVEFLNSKMRKYDLVFRFGGEEFLFAFPSTGISEAHELLERLREEIKLLPIEIPGGQVLNVTVSIGVAQMDPHSDERDIIELADKALLNAKLAGRDRVCVWQ